MANLWGTISEDKRRLKMVYRALFFASLVPLSACQRDVKNVDTENNLPSVQVALGTVELSIPANCFADKPRPPGSSGRSIDKEALLLQFIWPKAACRTHGNIESFRAPGYGGRMIVLLQRSGSKYPPEKVFHRRLITVLNPGRFTAGEGLVPKPSKYENGEQHYNLPAAKLHPGWQETIIASDSDRSIAYCTPPPVKALSPFALGGCRIEWYDDEIYYDVSFGPEFFKHRRSIKNLIAQKIAAFKQGVK